jgi:hypothetical protein
MDTHWEKHLPWNETVSKTLGLLTDRGYNINLSAKTHSFIAEQTEAWLLTFLFVLLLFAHERISLKPQNPLPTMLFTVFILNLVGYFGGMWIVSPIHPSVRASIEILPFAFASIALAVMAILVEKAASPPLNEPQKLKLKAMWGYHIVVAGFFLIRSFGMDTFETVNRVALGHAVSCVSRLDEFVWTVNNS